MQLRRVAKAIIGAKVVASRFAMFALFLDFETQLVLGLFSSRKPAEISHRTQGVGPGKRASRGSEYAHTNLVYAITSSSDKVGPFLATVLSIACVQTSPLPQKKIGRRDFFLREGGSLYTGYFVDQEMRLAIHFDGRSNLQKTLKQFKIITKIEIK